MVPERGSRKITLSGVVLPANPVSRSPATPKVPFSAEARAKRLMFLKSGLPEPSTAPKPLVLVLL